MKTFSKHILMASIDKFFHFVSKKYTHYRENESTLFPLLQLENYKLQVPVSGILHESGKYISTQLHTKINKLTFYNIHGNYMYDGIPITLNIFHRGESKKTITTIYDVINFVIYYCKSLKKTHPSSVNIKLVLSPYKKTLPKIGNAITAHNVNSGFTSRNYGTNNSSIVIYRKEEIIKVLIHELLHAFDIDSKMSSKPYENDLLKLYSFKELNGGLDHINVNESFTDTYACLLNIALVALKSNKKVNYFLEMVHLEQNHIISVAEKIMSHIGLNIQNGNTIVKMQPKQFEYSETTHVISYYILKALNLINLNGFLSYLIENNYQIESIATYVDYVYKMSKNIKWNKQISNVRGVYKLNTENLNSILMSSIDILKINKRFKKSI